MIDIKRYYLDCDNGIVDVSPDGPWVAYSEYAALLSAKEQAERDGQQLQFALEQSESAYTKLAAERDALKALCEQRLRAIDRKNSALERIFMSPDGEVIFRVREIAQVGFNDDGSVL